MSRRYWHVSMILASFGAMSCRTGGHGGASNILATTADDPNLHINYVNACGPQPAGSGSASAPAAASPAVSADAVSAALSVKSIFTEHQCANCHVPGKAEDAGTTFDAIFDRDKMAAAGLFNLSDPAKSKLFKFVKNGSMPAQDDTLNPTPKALGDADVAAVLKWLTLGAPAFDAVTTSAAPGGTVAVDFISEADKIACIQRDVDKLDASSRPFTRYLSFEHLYNDKVSPAVLQGEFEALSKALNSLSVAPTISRPLAVDPARVIFRIDLRNFGWSIEKWNSVLGANPYAVTFESPAALKLYQATTSKLPYMRGDWFTFAVTKPPLYHTLLDIPETSQALAKKLGVNMLGDIAAKKVARAGFVHSDVSQNNRMIERHVIPQGAYWQSYDFASSNGAQNLMQNPLGPCLLPGENAAGFSACALGDAALSAAHVFHHNGGEIIFNLPNGLQAYLLTTNDGKRLDVGPTNIVTDLSRPGGGVVNGVSCMGCHTHGMIRKDDEIVKVVQNVPQFSNALIGQIKTLYVPSATLNGFYDADEKRFAAAITALGSAVVNADGSAKEDPVRSVVKRFEGELDLAQVAHEFGVTPEDFKQRVVHAPNVQLALGSLLNGGIIKRDQFNQQFFTNLKELGLGTPLGEEPTEPDVGSQGPSGPSVPVTTLPGGWQDATPGGSCAANASNCMYSNADIGLAVSKAVANCGWDCAAATCKNLTLGGFSSGWRLPARSELEAVQKKDVWSLVSPSFIPQSAEGGQFWTSTDGSDQGYKTFVYLSLQGYGTEPGSSSAHVVCVKPIGGTAPGGATTGATSTEPAPVSSPVVTMLENFNSGTYDCKTADGQHFYYEFTGTLTPIHIGGPYKFRLKQQWNSNAPQVYDCDSDLVTCGPYKIMDEKHVSQPDKSYVCTAL